jgi:Amidohydrolase
MPMFGFLARSIATAILAMLVPAASAQQPQLKIFDSHMHYNAEASSVFALDQVLETFRRNGVAGIVPNSRPNRGTQQIVDAKPAGLWVVPFIRPYRVPSDVENWHRDPAIYDLIETEFKRGYYKGVGEFHIYGNQTENPIAKKAVDFAVQHDLYLLAHSDEAAVINMLTYNPKAKVIWAHTGFGTPEPLVQQMLEKYPTLWCELSYRSGITEGGGRLSAEWRNLFAKHSDRFLLGSDTWVNQRWSSYDFTMREYRGWLAQLPDDQAKRIAHGNAERLYGGKIE